MERRREAKEEEKEKGGRSLELKIRGTITFSYGAVGGEKSEEAITSYKIVIAFTIITMMQGEDDAMEVSNHLTVNCSPADRRAYSQEKRDCKRTNISPDFACGHSSCTRDEMNQVKK